VTDLALFFFRISSNNAIALSHPSTSRIFFDIQDDQKLLLFEQVKTHACGIVPGFLGVAACGYADASVGSQFPDAGMKIKELLLFNGVLAAEKSEQDGIRCQLRVSR